jgi:UDP-N-acetylmuramoyl-tripeptide--D-alanyl-D-alanine ligase
MNHRGEIAPLAKIAKPNIGIITNIGTAHIEHLGSQEEISKEKGDLVANLGPDSTAVLNADDPFVMSQSERCLGRTITFGYENAAEVMARDVESLGDYGFSYNLVTDRGSQNVKIKGLGESTVINSLAASAGAIAAGVTLEQIQEGLHKYEPPRGRMEKILLDNNICLIHDAYNANPQSLRNALTSLTRLKTSNRGIAVLGDMGELGSASPEAHRKSGELAAELGVSLLFLIGDWAEKVRAGALANGMSNQQIMISKDLKKLGESIREALRENDWVLIKGSRSMQMERLVEYLVRSS